MDRAERPKIKRIRETDPYAYKYILEDPKAFADKKKSLEDELQSYKEYAVQLDEVIEGLGIKPGDTKWRMN